MSCIPPCHKFYEIEMRACKDHSCHIKDVKARLSNTDAQYKNHQRKSRVLRMWVSNYRVRLGCSRVSQHDDPLVPVVLLVKSWLLHAPWIAGFSLVEVVNQEQELVWEVWSYPCQPFLGEDEPLTKPVDRNHPMVIRIEAGAPLPPGSVPGPGDLARAIQEKWTTQRMIGYCLVVWLTFFPQY